MGAVDVKQMSDHELVLEWDSSASNDMIADSTLALITGIDKSPASVKRTSLLPLRSTNAIPTLTKLIHRTVTSTSHSHSHSHSSSEPPSHPHPHADVIDEKADKSAENTRIRRLAMFLEAHFGDVELHMPEEPSSDSKDEQENPEEPPKDQEPALLVTMDEAEAIISLGSLVRRVSKTCHLFIDYQPIQIKFLDRIIIDRYKHKQHPT